jgi:putative transposase
VPNRTSLPGDVIAFMMFCRLRYRLTLRDLSEILLLRGIEVSHEAIRDWETKLLPIMGRNSASGATASSVALTVI